MELDEPGEGPRELGQLLGCRVLAVRQVAGLISHAKRLAAVGSRTAVCGGDESSS
jgi:hypothetical protein